MRRVLTKALVAGLVALFVKSAAHGLVLVSISGSLTQIPDLFAGTARVKASTRSVVLSMTPADVGSSWTAVVLLRDWWGVSCNTLVNAYHNSRVTTVQGVGQIHAVSYPNVGFRSFNCSSKAFNVQSLVRTNAGQVIWNGQCQACCV